MKSFDARTTLLDEVNLEEELARRRAANPLKYAQKHLKQKVASLARKKLRALFWGNRCGKTEWGAMEVAAVLLGEHPFIDPCEVWSFCPSFDAQAETTQLKLLRYLPEKAIVSRTWLRKGILKELVVKGAGGVVTKVNFKSYEQGRDKAQGAGKGLIWFDEEPPKDIFDECSVRQEAGVPLYIIMTMTPVNGMTWVYHDIYLNTANPDIFVSQASWKDNPFLTEEQVNEMRRRLTPQALKVREEGQFVKQVGLVCAWFRRDVHVVDIRELPPGEDYLAIDFGFSDPCCGLYARLDREGNLWVHDGWYRRGMTNPDIQKVMAQKEAGLRGRVRRIGDSAQASDIEQLNQAGYEIVGVKKASGTSRESWDEYRARLMETHGAVAEATGKPKIFISSKLVDVNDNPRSPLQGQEFNFLVAEAENLRWEEVRGEGGKEQKPVWGKQPKHAVDTLTYILASIDPAGASGDADYAYQTGGVAPLDQSLGGF